MAHQQGNQRGNNWKDMPGGFDALNTRHLYGSNNDLDIPELPQAPLSAIPDWLAPYRTRVRSKKGIRDGGMHFFLDDYRFESVWRRPTQTLSSIAKWNVVLTPDFSLFYDTPRIIQMWNTYRSRWVGCWWIDNDIQVIPTVSWGLHDSYDFAFLGLPDRSVLAVSTIGTHNDPSARLPYLAGFREMIERLQPTAVLCYGKPYRAMLDLTDVRIYPDYWQGVASARRKFGHTQNYDDLYDDDDNFKMDY